MLTEKNRLQLKEKGISIAEFDKQMALFKSGFPYITLKEAATLNNGILHFPKSQQFEFAHKYENALIRGIKVMKFVPASGAASRMFKEYFEFIEKYQEGDSLSETIQEFKDEKEHFAFWDSLQELASQKGVENDLKEIIKLLLLPDGLGYGNCPKGVIAFHKYEETTKTPVSEHLTEGAYYICDNKNEVNIHFTVSPEHLTLFEKAVNDVKSDLEKEFSVKYNISFSFQKPSTDTVAVTLNNEPFIKPNGDILFRPAGHGALIENLNDLDADLIFIKNIDNVAGSHLLDETIHYKKMLAGILLELQSDIFSALKGLEFDGLDEKSLTAISENLYTKWKFNFIPNLKALPIKEQISALQKELSKPIRVCGMVENEGEAGGGPFWCLSESGSVSLQIVEGSQIDPKSESQQHLLRSSTHFNPVDLVIATKNYKGEKFNIPEFVDKSAGFISEKSLNGIPLKAMELPGLWNGGMSNWITLFVEVPIVTFNPVKSLNDLLRFSHQPKEARR